MADATVRLSGETDASVAIPGTFEVTDRRVAFQCSSGERIERDYRGVPVAAVLESVGVPGETTHLRVTARDGHVACPDIRDALDGILAVGGSGAPRFVAPGITGPRAIKRVRRIEALALSPGDDPTAHEGVPPDA